MRIPWRLLLLRCSTRSQQPHFSKHFSLFQSHSNSTPYRRFSSSLLGSDAARLLSPSFASQFQGLGKPSSRPFSSSELAIEHKDSDHVGLLTDMFSKPPRSNDEIKLELESNNVVLTHDLVLKVLRSLDAAPDAARRFFNWVSTTEGERLSSKSYNFLLGILGANGLVHEFWELVGVMKKLGYGVSKGTQVKVLGKFEKEGMHSDLEKLKEIYASGSVDNSIEKVSSRVCKVIRQELWGDEVEKQLRDLNIEYSSDLVAMVVENLGTGPNKALIFFRWIEESNLLKHDERSYNAMARVLGREDCIDKFWRVVNEMKDAGYEMEGRTYVEVSGKFIKRSMLKEAVDLYKFAMGGSNKPSVHDCTFLLKKIVVGKELDFELFLEVVKIFTEGGNVFTNSTMDAVLKSLTSVDRYQECNNVLKAMKEGAFLPGDNLQSKIAFKLTSEGKKDEASEFLDHMEASGCEFSHRTWASLVGGHCIAGDLDEASGSFQKMIEKEGVSGAGYALELLVKQYCSKKRSSDAYKLLTDVINEKDLKPWHSTYKLLIRKLLVQGHFNEAVDLLGLMKNHGFPPFIDPFVEYVTKTGTTDNAMTFLKGMSVKRFPSTSVVLRVFDAYMKAGKHDEAQVLLSKCPRFIRNHADVLNLFFSMKPEVSASGASVTS